MIPADAVELLSIAMEHTGAEAARPFVEQAQTMFPTVVDKHGVASTILSFKAVPNGVLVDEHGIVRRAKYGGFSIDKPEDVGVAARFLHGEDPGPSPAMDAPYTLGPIERELIDTTLRLGWLLDSLNRLQQSL